MIFFCHLFFVIAIAIVLVFAYGPKSEVAKRCFFESEVVDATLMMGWGGMGWGGAC